VVQGCAACHVDRIAVCVAVRRRIFSINVWQLLISWRCAAMLLKSHNAALGAAKDTSRVTARKFLQLRHRAPS